MTNELSTKLKTLLVKEGVFYPCPHGKAGCTVVLEEINEQAEFTQEE